MGGDQADKETIFYVGVIKRCHDTHSPMLENLTEALDELWYRIDKCFFLMFGFHKQSFRALFTVR